MSDTDGQLREPAGLQAAARGWLDAEAAVFAWPDPNVHGWRDDAVDWLMKAVVALAPPPSPEAEAAALDPDFAALRDLSEKATPGCWYHLIDTYGGDDDEPGTMFLTHEAVLHDKQTALAFALSMNDAAFIVAMEHYVRERLRAKAGSAAE